MPDMNADATRDERVARGFSDAMLRGELSLASSEQHKHGDVRPEYLRALTEEYERRWPGLLAEIERAAHEGTVPA